jgi:hypothetical protein
VSVHPSKKRFVGLLGGGYVALFATEENKMEQMVKE